MKKFLALLMICTLTFAASAQFLTPRFGVGTDFFGGNKGVKYTPSFALNNTPDVAGLDTVKMFGNVFRQYVSPSDSVQDTLVYCFKSLASCYAYDELAFNFISRNATTKIKFRNKYTSAFVFTTAGDSTITLTAKQRARITFVFDGAKWLETGKVVK